MALVTMPTIMPRLSVPTVIILIIPMIARLTASTDQTGSQAGSLLEPGRGFMASGAGIGAGVITDAVALAADAAVSTADVAVPAADVEASVADVAAAVDSTEVVEAGSTAAVAVPMAVGMVGATDN